MQFIDYFDRVEIINLESRKDRKKDLVRQLSRLDKVIDRDSIRFFNAISPNEKGKFPSIGARGCFESHLTILKSAMEDNVRELLILEDDLNFCDEINSLSILFYDLFKDSEWGFSYLGHTIKNIEEQQCPYLIEVDNEIGVTCTHIIAISGKIIPDLVKYFEAMYARPPGDPNGGPMHVDGAYNWYRRYSKCKTVMTSPPLGYQRSSRSNIAKNKFYDRLPIIRNLINYIRKLKN